MIRIDHHNRLSLGYFTCAFAQALDDMKSPPWLLELLALDAKAPMSADDHVRSAVRGLLKQGGFKPTGRSKPASEYLLKAASDSKLSSINAAVDACNVVSLHSGLPISVVDLDRLDSDLRIGIAERGEQYIFNLSGQVIDLEGLLCLFDRTGACANAVKDAQRTKTQADTRRTLCLVWGSSELGDRTERAMVWYQDILKQLGGTIDEYHLSTPETREQ